MKEKRSNANIEMVIRAMSRDQKLVHERRQLISECALPLFMKHGLDRTSVRQITKACNMSVGALYHYVGSKDDIGLLLAEQMRQEVAAFMGNARECGEPAESLRCAIAKWCRFCDRFQDNIVFLYREFGNITQPVRERVVDLDAKCIGMFEKILTRGVNVGVFGITNTKAVALDICVCGHMWAFRRWYLRKFISLDDYVEDQADFFINGALSKR